MIIMSCCFCQSSVDGLLTVHLEYDGFVFSAFNNFQSDLLCATCAIKNHIEKFDKYGRKIISKKGDEIQAEWHVYVFPGEEAERHAWNDILLSLGVFSLNPGGWVLLEDGRLKDPGHWHGKRCYFTRKRDITEYQRALYRGEKIFTHEILKIDEAHPL